MKKRKYLLFMFGDWVALEKTPEVFTNVMEILESLIVSNDLSFITGDHIMIVYLETTTSFEDVSSFLNEFLTPKVSTYFVMPMPRKLEYRLDKKLEQHLFGKKKSIPSKKRDTRVTPKPPKLRDNLNAIAEYKIRMLQALGTIVPPPPFPLGTPHPITLDEVLDKISALGIESLTTFELEFLNQHSKN